MGDNSQTKLLWLLTSRKQDKKIYYYNDLDVNKKFWGIIFIV